VALHVARGQDVAAGDALAVVEGMKMQHTIRAGRAGRVERVRVEEGELVDADAVLFEITPR
jgi:3-methylcrotonyl-CoA carboxylase alpha subunit